MKSLSNIIKSHEPCLHEKHVDVFFTEERFNNDESQSHGIVDHEHARQRAHEEKLKQIRAHAEAEAARIVSEAETFAAQERQRGFDEGIRRGLELVAPLEDVLRGLIEELKLFRTRFCEETEPDVVHMVLAVSKKIIKDHLENDHTVIVRTVRDALTTLIDRERLTIRIHEKDYDVMETFKHELIRSFHDIKHLDIIKDPTVGRGGCIMETRQGSVDATIETQSERLVELLTTEKTG